MHKGGVKCERADLKQECYLSPERGVKTQKFIDQIAVCQLDKCVNLSAVKS
jgi:hypothetical protein